MSTSEPNRMISINAVLSTGACVTVSVHVFDQIRELYSKLDVANVTFVYNSCRLLDAMTFAFYEISDGAVIVVVVPPVKKRKEEPRFRWRIDTNRPIRIDMDPAMPLRKREILYRYLTNAFNPNRCRILARHIDRQFDLKEMKGRLFRKMCAIHKQCEEREIEETEQPAPSPSVIRNSDAPPASELPVSWNTDGSSRDPIWKNSIMIPLVQYKEY